MHLFPDDGNEASCMKRSDIENRCPWTWTGASECVLAGTKYKAKQAVTWPSLPNMDRLNSENIVENHHSMASM